MDRKKVRRAIFLGGAVPTGGFDADWIRMLATEKGTWTNIPPRSNRNNPICFSPYLFRARNQVERFFTPMGRYPPGDRPPCHRRRRDRALSRRPALASPSRGGSGSRLLADGGLPQGARGSVELLGHRSGSRRGHSREDPATTLVSVVVSDTSPLHYLILCSVDAVLPRLFERVIIPPTVFVELQHPNTPALVQEWMKIFADLDSCAKAHLSRSFAECRRWDCSN
jgi:transposase